MTPRPPAPARLVTHPWWKPAGPQTLGRLESPARCWPQAGPAGSLLATVLVLWAGPALGQTITISPTTAQTLQEGQALKVTLTVNGLATGQAASIDFPETGTASVNDFEVYQQATEPSGSDTPVTLEVLDNGYAYYEFATDSDPVGPVTFWVLAKTDTVLLDPDLRLLIKGEMYIVEPFESIADTSVLTVTLTDATPIPAPTGKPTTPANLTATAGKGAVTLSWDAVDATSSNTNFVNDVQITKHQVRQSTDGGTNYGTWTDIPNSAYGGANAASYTIGSLADGTEYTLQVRAVNGCTTTAGCGESDPATAIMATPDADGLAAPTGLMATAGNTEITLTWTDPGDAAIWYYEYQQKEGAAAFGPWTEIPRSTATTTSYRLTGLNNGTAYSYRIRARTNVKTGPTSDAVTVTPRGGAPAAPVLTATPRNGGVTLSWPNPVDASLARWEYQYKIGAGVYQPWETARRTTVEACGSSTAGVCVPPYLDTSGATLQFAVGGLTNGTAHTFRIRAVNVDGRTVSNEASATPVGGVPAQPTGLTTRVSNSVRILEWNRVADPSILRYEYTTDEGRTWSDLTSDGDEGRLPKDEFLSGYTFRIRAVNAAGPGPASDPAVEEEAEATASPRIVASGVSVEWDSTTEKAVLVWNPARSTAVRFWRIYVSRTTPPGTNANTELPIGTTRYELPGTRDGGDRISVWVYGCATLSSRGCPVITNASHEATHAGFRVDLLVGAPQTRPTGFSVIPGDAQITLAWEDPMDSSITKYQYQLNRSSVFVDIPDGDDADTDPGNETSYTVTMFEGANLVNGDYYSAQLRAVNANGAGPMDRAGGWQGSGPRGAGAPERACDARIWRRRADDLGRSAGPQHHHVSEARKWDVGEHPRHRRDHHRRRSLRGTAPSGQCQGRGVVGGTHVRIPDGAGAADGLAGRTRKRPGDPDLGRPGERRLHRVLSLHRRRRGDVDRPFGQPHEPARPPHPLPRSRTSPTGGPTPSPSRRITNIGLKQAPTKRAPPFLPWR